MRGRRPLENGGPVRTASERSSGASRCGALLISFSCTLNPGEGPQRQQSPLTGMGLSLSGGDADLQRRRKQQNSRGVAASPACGLRTLTGGVAR